MNKLLWCILFSVALIVGCCKKDECKADRNGSLTLRTTMYHHNRLIKGCQVYVKFNASEYPGDDLSQYDLNFTTDNNSTSLEIPGLNCGDYYVYAIGIDSLLDPTNWVVKGGVPMSTIQKEGTVQLNVYVTEGD